MSDSNGGFSFGGPGQQAPRDDEVDAIEVSGEPVTRSEAKNLGFATLATTLETSRSMTTAIRRDDLPPDMAPEFRAKLERAWNHLKKNEIEEALTLGQEVVFEYPSLVAAKVIIARCFILRKAYDKALAILSAIADTEQTAESLYYLGLCQSRLGRIKDAIDTLKASRAVASDSVIRKRANDLLLHLQGEQTVCPVCGKKTLYDSMVDMDNQTVCASCAKTLAEVEDESEDFVDDEDEEMDSGKKKRKKLRPPLTKTEILIRFVFAVFICVVAAFAIYALSIVSPEYYATFRGWLPANWTFLPPAIDTRYAHTPPPAMHVAPPVAEPVSNITFDSPTLHHAVVGMEIRHKLLVDGMGDREGLYGIVFSPDPDGPYVMNSDKGEFTWTPSEADAGKEFEIKFSGLFGNLRIRDQINTVRVSAGPRFKNVAAWDTPLAGEILHLVAEDMSNTGHKTLIVVTGEYWQGEIGAFSEAANGQYVLESRTSIPGRPAAAGIIVADGEKWLAIADYWNSRLRHYALRSGSLSEMAVDIDLPGRPVLAGFDKTSATSAVLCRTAHNLTMVSYRQENQLTSIKVGEWEVPDNQIWKDVFVLPAGDAAQESPAVLLIGADPVNAIFLFERGNPAPRPIRLGVDGTIIDTVLSPDGLVYCLVDNAGQRNLVSFRPGRDGRPGEVTMATAGSGPALGGLAAVPFSGREGAADLVVLSATQVGISFKSATGGLGTAAFWDLPKPSRLYGGLVTLPATPDLPARVAFMDIEGEIWTIDLSQGE